jgi:putative membrane protein
MSKHFFAFIIRWLANSLGLWLAVHLLGTGLDNVEVSAGTIGFLFAGLIFSIVNGILRPFIIILSLPAILVTLGLFMFVVNGLMVYISLSLAPGISMSFLNSILAGILLSLVNYIVSVVLTAQSDSSE